MPTANAMSVAMGTPHPARRRPPAQDQEEQAGTATPPSAANAAARGARVAQLAGDELALDLQADDEEEQRHQPVVDPLLHAFGDRPLTVAHRE